MRCANCGLEVSEGARFCGGCGEPLRLECSHCHARNPLRFTYCAECGSPLDETQFEGPQNSTRNKTTSPGSAVRRRVNRVRKSSAGAERRHLTVMFCDLVGSTELSTRVDPEDLREVVRTYRDYCAKLVSSFDGHVAQFLGDGIMAYFGYPAAHEDDAGRAVRAGLKIIEQLPNLNARLAHPIRIRIGIHTGIVVVGENELFGATPNLASRIQATAGPNEIAVSLQTYRLVEGLFACEALDEVAFKGVARPLKIYRVLRESGASSRFDVALRSGLTPLVGRDAEIGLLREKWERAKAGSGQAVVLSGEAGIGKSRLAEVLRESARAERANVYEIRCSPYHQNTAFFPLIQLLQQLLTPRESPGKSSLHLVERWAKANGFDPAEIVPQVASLLSMPLPDHYPPVTLAPQRQRERLQEMLVDTVVKATALHPLLIAYEDLHWADASTLELLRLQIDRTPSCPVMFLVTTRPELKLEWEARDHVSVVQLNRLEPKHAVTMVQQVTSGRRLPGEVLSQIVLKTDGVPLFIEELTKAVIQSGLLTEGRDGFELTGPLPPLAIPDSLHDSLIARLDRMAAEKEVVQIGAVVGREFSYTLLREVARIDDAALRHALARLVTDDLLHQRGAGEDASYVFKHALIQDAAYESLLKGMRQVYHQRTADVLERRLAENGDSHTELLAHHYTEAGLTTQSLPYWLEAGRVSLARSANIEAVNHLTRGLELLATLPDSPERLQSELAFQTNLGMAWMATKGYAAPETRRAYDRARELCSRAGESPQLVPILIGLANYFIVRAEYGAACEIAEQTLRLAATLNDNGSAMEAHIQYGYALFYMGEFEQARGHLARGIELYDPVLHQSSAWIFGHEPRMAVSICNACALWITGYPDQAAALCEQGLRHAHESSHALTLAFALTYASMLHHWLGRDETAVAFAVDAISISAEQGLTFWSAAAALHRGAGEAGLRPSEGTIAVIEAALASWEATGARAPGSYFRFQHSAVLARAGHTSRAMTSVNRGLAELGSERFFQAELYRLKGELILQAAGELASADSRDEAEECFMRALEVSRRRNAKSFELRAAMSLANLWRQTGRTAPAALMLREVYGWFTEGFDSADLKRARELLKELS
jgi:class 3 adenylate cyclase/tetratricopeptide (TPR) repeat protein